jgi:hypothetical protein
MTESSAGKVNSLAPFKVDGSKFVSGIKEEGRPGLWLGG